MEMNLNMIWLTPTAALFINLSEFTWKHNYSGLATACCGTHLIPTNASKDGQLADKEVFLHTDDTRVECCVPDTHTDCNTTCN